MEFRIKLNHCSFLLGLLLSFCKSNYLYIVISTIVGLSLPYLDKNNLSINGVEYFIFGFTFGSVSTYFFEIVIGLILGYCVSNYGKTNEYIANRYNFVKDIVKNYSVRIENGYLIRENQDNTQKEN